MSSGISATQKRGDSVSVVPIIHPRNRRQLGRLTTFQIELHLVHNTKIMASSATRMSEAPWRNIQAQLSTSLPDLRSYICSRVISQWYCQRDQTTEMPDPGSLPHYGSYTLVYQSHQVILAKEVATLKQ